MTIWEKGQGIELDKNYPLYKGTYVLTFKLPLGFPSFLEVHNPRTVLVPVAGIGKRVILKYVKKDGEFVKVKIQILDNPIPLIAIIIPIGLGLGVLFLAKLEKVAELPITYIVAGLAAFVLIGTRSKWSG